MKFQRKIFYELKLKARHLMKNEGFKDEFTFNIH